MNWLPVLSGEDKKAGAAILRVILRGVEPFYASAMRVRNRLYDQGTLRSHTLGRAAISVGNLTTGGTGKTPMVHWLVEQLYQSGHRPAILIRGYRAANSQIADEPELLRQLLGEKVAVQVNPDRVAGAAEVLKQNPAVDVLILDDAFQHRRARRNFDLLLVSATQPFGYGHVLPRGLLREPISSAERADAIVITHADLVSPDKLAAIVAELPPKPTYYAVHSLKVPQDCQNKPYAIFSGIGDPQTFENQLTQKLGRPILIKRWRDHHAYDARTLAEFAAAARCAGAEQLLTTQKDFVKLHSFADTVGLPVRAIGLRIELLNEGANRLMTQIHQSINLPDK